MPSSGQKRSGAQVAMPQPVARALRRLSQEDLAQRIGTSLSTVRRMEEGYSGTALHTFLRALHVLGRLDDLSRAMSLEKDALGMELVRELLPQRVRSLSRRQRPPAGPTSGGGDGDADGNVDVLEGF